MIDTEEISKLYEGVNWQIELLYSRIEITRRGAKAFLCHGFDGTKTIFLRNLRAIQFKFNMIKIKILFQKLDYSKTW